MNEGFKFGEYYDFTEFGKNTYREDNQMYTFADIAKALKGEIWTPTQLDGFGNVVALLTASGKEITEKDFSWGSYIFSSKELSDGLEGYINKVSSLSKEKESSNNIDHNFDKGGLHSDESVLSQLKELFTQTSIEYHVCNESGEILDDVDDFETAQEKAVKFANTHNGVTIKINVTLSKTVAEVKTEYKVKMIESNELEDLFSGALS